jgi:hypothetical protein
MEFLHLTIMIYAHLRMMIFNIKTKRKNIQEFEQHQAVYCNIVIIDKLCLVSTLEFQL